MSQMKHHAFHNSEFKKTFHFFQEKVLLYLHSILLKDLCARYVNFHKLQIYMAILNLNGHFMETIQFLLHRTLAEVKSSANFVSLSNQMNSKRTHNYNDKIAN